MCVVSLILACRNEERYIRECVTSLLKQDFPAELTEILIIDGKSTDNTVAIVEELAKDHKNIFCFSNEKKISTTGFNIGAREAKGDFVILMGAHCTYPANYISKLVKYGKDTDADIVGGRVYVKAKHETPLSVAIRTALSHRWGVGDSMYKMENTEVQEVDTVAYGCYNRRVFTKYGYFNEDLVRNQDIEINKRIKNQGGKILLVPDVSVDYFSAEDLKSFSRKNYQNGYWNPLTVYYSGTIQSLSLRHFVPLMFVLGLLGALILGFLHPVFWWLGGAVLLFYFLFIATITREIRDKGTNWLQLIRAFATLHFSYGFGSLIGNVKVLKLAVAGNKK
ncbi:glycosyltransferase family 2 protein [Chitinophaga sp. RAB17]|uniref:glycosyltransferase family 2 protein n=1 Tax=Chitinophaga sp. RAB17 TaxID=3233049 RepID=UPI003F8FC514